MMHDPSWHPDDESLAALADAEDGSATSTALRDHVSRCDRCTALVDELRSLTAALATLPDVAPPRQLRLLPPVEPDAPRTAWWPRRVALPVFAAGLVLIIAGGVGSVASSGFGAAGGSAFRATTEDRQAPAAAPSAAPSAAFLGEDGSGAVASPRGAGDDVAALPSVIWPGILALGLGMVLLAALLRFLIAPRAG